jgi:chemotaxis protein CheZ
MSNPQEELLRKIMSEVTDKLTKDLRTVLARTLKRQISAALPKSLLQSEFYRRISEDMRGGLKRIYKEINTAAKEGQNGSGDVPIMNKDQADKLFHEASEQLNAVLAQTEKATEEIMNVVESHMETQSHIATILSKDADGVLPPEDFEWLRQANKQSGEDLNNVLVTLSFQDLTGQRIKRAVKALQEIESTVVELYLSTGLLMQAYEETPDKDLDQIQQETKKTVESLKGGKSIVDSALKGPTDVSQGNIDALLAQLGMD